MWKPVAAELGIPWRTAEGMHWIIGEQEMARRANVHPFSSAIQPSSSSMTSAPSNTRNHKGYMLNSSMAFDDQDVSTSESPITSQGAHIGPVTPYAVPIAPSNGSGARNRSRRSEMSCASIEDANAFQIRDINSESSFMDRNLSAPISPSVLNHFNESHPGDLSKTHSALLPSVAELEGGVSPFAIEGGRRESMSSVGSSKKSIQRSPALKTMTETTTTTTSRFTNGPR